MTVSKTKEQVYLEKVKKDGLSLKEIKENQTEAICLAAMKQNGMALQYVENQTEAICLIDLSLSPYHVLEQLYLR